MALGDDCPEAIEQLAARKLAARETQYGPVGSPEQWLRAVRDGIRIDHAGRIATMPPNLSVADQVKWIEYGPPVSGLRIPPPRKPIDYGEKARPEVVRAALAEARAFLGREKAGPPEGSPA